MLMTIFSLLVLLFSIILHEIAHGSVALNLGDSTAKNAGRLTLNPLKHLDLFGSVLLPLSLLLFTAGRGPIFGWAKPVPVNPFNFKDQRWGSLKVSVAGPSMNFLLAIIFGLSLRFIPLPEAMAMLFSIIVLYNFAWGIFNLMPIPPLDGSHILFSFLPASFNNAKVLMSQFGLFILLFFLFFGGLNFIFRAAAVLYYLLVDTPLFFW